MTEILQIVGAIIAGAGGITTIIIVAGRLWVRYATTKLDLQSATAEDTKTEARKDNWLMDQIETLTARVSSLESKQRTTETERDAAIEEGKSYKIAFEQSNQKYEKLQNEFAVMKSDYSRQEERIGKLEKDTIELRRAVDTAVGERDQLAKELEAERKSKLELEKIAAGERQRHAIEIARRDAKLEVYEDTNNKLLEKVQPLRVDSTEPPVSEAQEGAESKETPTEQNQ